MPSLTVAGPVSVTVGATLATVTVWVSVLPAAPSESLDLTDTCSSAGPSGKRAVETARPVLALNVSTPTWVPLAPQLGGTTLNGVCTRIADGEAVGVLVPSLTAVVDRDSVTVGATLATVTVWVAVLLVAPSESLDLAPTRARGGRAVRERAVETARTGGRVERVGADLGAVRAAARSRRARTCPTRIGDREAVGVGRALVDRGRAPVKGDRRGDVGDRDRERVGVGGAVAVADRGPTDGRGGRAVGERAVETARTGRWR